MTSNSELRRVTTVVAFSALVATTAIGVKVEAQEQPKSRVEQARALFNAGAQAYATNKYEPAVKAFKEAYRLSRRPGLLFSIAQARRRQYFVKRNPAHLLAAIRHYRQYIAAAPDGRRQGDAADALAQLEPMAAQENVSEGLGELAQPEKSSGQLMITSLIRGARLVLDGKDVGPLPYIADVPPGEHQLEVQALGYEPYRSQLRVKKGAIVPFNVPLTEKRAQLSVRGPEGSRVFINGRFAGESPMAPVRLAPGSYTVSVGMRGRRPDSRELVLGRGEHGTFTSDLPVTTQRKIAWSSMLVGGGALIASGVLGGFAYARQQDAKNWLDGRGEGELEEADLERYQSLRQDRDRLRNAALISGGAGAAVGLVGVILYVFDEPSAHRTGAYEQSAPPTPRDDPGDDPSMEVSGHPGELGLSVLRRF